MEEQLKVITLPTTQGFIEFLSAHAGPNAPMGQWGYFPNTRGNILSLRVSDEEPESKKWVGMPVTDGNGLMEAYISQSLEGEVSKRIAYHFDHWCYGHIGDNINEIIQLPGCAVFKTDGEGRFTDVGYLYQKTGNNPLDWAIFVCNDFSKGLCIETLDSSWTHWGLPSMVLRHNLKGPFTENLLPLPKGTPYGVVWSSVLNFRDAQDRHLVTSIPNGTVVELTGKTDGSWTQCKIGDHLGYVFGKFLVKHKG